MKVSTDLKSGSAVDSAIGIMEDVVFQLGDFVVAADQQAEVATQKTIEVINAVWQGVTGGFR